MTRTAASVLCLAAPFVGALLAGNVGAGFGVGLPCGAALFLNLEA